jgi:hypothetical protein
VFNIFSLQRNANQNFIEISSQPYQKGCYLKKITNAGTDVNKRECKLVQSLWETIGRFLQKFKVDVLYYSTIPILGIYPKITKSLYERHT